MDTKTVDGVEKGLTYFNDYDEVLLTFTKDTNVDPATYTYTQWIFEGEDFVKREEVLTGLTDEVVAQYYDDEFIAMQP